jgi:hypothetical protein
MLDRRYGTTEIRITTVHSSIHRNTVDLLSRLLCYHVCLLLTTTIPPSIPCSSARSNNVKTNYKAKTRYMRNGLYEKNEEKLYDLKLSLAGDLIALYILGFEGLDTGNSSTRGLVLSHDVSYTFQKAGLRAHLLACCSTRGKSTTCSTERCASCQTESTESTNGEPVGVTLQIYNVSILYENEQWVTYEGCSNTSVSESVLYQVPENHVNNKCDEGDNGTDEGED